MLKRLTTTAVGVAGLVVIGLGIASATVWRADDVLVATTSGGPHTLVTDPGVLELGGDPVTVEVSVPDGGEVVLAIGRDTDVAGWVGSDAHGRVTGLSEWHTLAVDDVEAPVPTPAPTDAAPTAAAPADAVPVEPAPADAATPVPTEGATDAPATAADPTGSDLWVAEVSGTGTAELVWPAQEGRWSLLAVSTGESAPTLALAWPRVVTTPWLWPCVAVGSLLVLLAVWLLLRDVRRRRAGLDEPRWHPVSTGSTPAVVVSNDIDAIPVLTRRQLREAAQSHATRPRSGPVPQVPAPQPQRSPAQPPSAEPSRTPVPTGASGTTPPGAVTSRRALRPPTGAIPVSPSPSSEQVSAGAWAPSSSPTAPRPPGVGAPAPTAAPTGRSGAPGHVSGTSAGPSGAPGYPGGTSAGPSGAPGYPGGTSAGQGRAPGYPGGASAAPGGAPGRAGGSASAPGGAPVGGPADQGSVAPHGRPSWVRGSATPPAQTPPAPAAPPPSTGPAGWSAVPPPPGARLRPGSPAGPDASVHAGRPAWVRPAAPESPATDDPANAGSRADAWRRAWGLPPTEGADAAPSDTDTRGEQR